MTGGWLERARSVGLEQVAAEVGMERHGQHWSPCPSCNEATRSSTDTRRGCVYPTRHGMKWACSRCDAHGDALDLVSYHLQRGRMDAASAPAVRAWMAARGWCEAARDGEVFEPVRPRKPPPSPVERKPPPPEQVAELWDRCVRAVDVPAAADWLRSRALDPRRVTELDLARALPVQGELPRWAQHWRTTRPAPVVMALWSPAGLVGLQGRRVDGERPKSVAARGVARVGVYADAAGQRMLLGRGERPAHVLVAEGEPDWLTWASRSQVGAVLGIPGGGAWTAEVAACVPDGAEVLVRSHHDRAGAGYAKEIRESLRPRCRVLVPR